MWANELSFLHDSPVIEGAHFVTDPDPVQRREDRTMKKVFVLCSNAMRDVQRATRFLIEGGE